MSTFLEEHRPSAHHSIRTVTVWDSSPYNDRVWIPPRLGWWAQRRRARLCRTTIRHCWHPDPASLPLWDCCECGATYEGRPPNWCQICHDPHYRAMIKGENRG